MDKRFLIVELQTQTASFRNPEFQNFHRSLQLPPPTTVFGLAGAALGLGPKATQEFFNTGGWGLGIHGFSQGKVKDLWKYRTLNDAKPTSIINREILYQNYFILLFYCEDAFKLEKLEKAFDHPVYALTMGNSDSLAKITRLYWSSETIKSKKVENCLVEGDVISKVLARGSEEPEFSIYSTSEPIVHDLPTRFNYKSEYGVRNVVERKVFSFIGHPMVLNFEVDGVAGTDKEGRDFFIPILSIN